MALLLFVLLAVVATRVALARSQALAPWFLATGLGLVGAMYLLGRFRVPWPDFGLWTVFLLNPYLLLTLGFTLTVGGGIGVAVTIVRRLSRRFRGES